MALCIYSNGILEEFKAKNLIFTDEEISSFFTGYKKIRSFRLKEVPNTWCLWGEPEKNEDIEYNRLGSDIVEEHIFSHIIFIHDTEINPDWNLTDKIIYYDYNKFVNDIKKLLDEVAENILNEKDEDDEILRNERILLDSIGYSKDKKVLFSFDPLKQTENFYKKDSFFNFATQINEFLINNKVKKPLVIYNDKKMIISVEDDKVNILFDKMLDIFGQRENYEICNKITEFKSKWNNISEKPKKVRGRKKSHNDKEKPE